MVVEVAFKGREEKTLKLNHKDTSQAFSHEEY